MQFLSEAHGIFVNIRDDNRLSSSHICLYFALLMVWQEKGFSNPFSISRKLLISISKIGSLATYHKAIKDLEKFGYIKYTPNFNSFIGSSVSLILS